jgi:ABC-type transporter Mla subunit MlaD
VVWLGTAKLDREVAYYVTFFDESVMGLDVGSPVKFRGVNIGNVARIGIASDRRHVEVESEVDMKIMRGLGLDRNTLRVPGDLRLQLASAGVTGLKFLQADFFSVKDHPLPKLPFSTPDNYLPAAPSTLKSLEDSVVQSVGRFPEATDEAILVMHQVNELLEDVNAQGIPERVVSTMGRIDKVVDDGRQLVHLAQKKVSQVDVEKISANLVKTTENLAELSSKGSTTLDGINGSVARINRILARAERQGGMMDDIEETIKTLKAEARQLEGSMALVKTTMSSIKNTADAFSNVARDASGLTDEAGHMMKVVGEAADAVRRVADVLERDSDMLVKGRARSKEEE